MDKRRTMTSGYFQFKLLILCTICIAMGGLWILAAAPTTSSETDTPIEIANLTPEENKPFSMSFLWSFSPALDFMRILGSGAVEPDCTQTDKLTAPKVSLETVDGKLIARFSLHCRKSLENGIIAVDDKCPDILPPQQKAVACKKQSTTCHAEQVRQIRRRQPSGEYHVIRHILLSCIVPIHDEAKAPTIYLQQIEVDTQAGTVDLIPCMTPARYAQLPARDYRTLTNSGLQEKYNGAPIRRDMLRLLYAIAAIDSPLQAATAANELDTFAWDLAKRAPEPKKDWPHNWGQYAEDAQEIAKELTPTLIYLQEHNCFDSEELADFINGSAFGAIFGDSFTDAPHTRTQEEPIEFVPLQD